ncbi:MAG: NAD-binding protein, partial [Sphingobium sp.]
RAREQACVIIESDVERLGEAEAAGFEVVRGDAVEPRVLAAAGIDRASSLLIAVPEGFEGGAIYERARRLNLRVSVIARAHSDAEVQHLEKLGVPHVVMGERELAARMLALCRT